MPIPVSVMVSFFHLAMILIDPPALLYLIALDMMLEKSIWKCFFSMMTWSDSGISRVVVRFFFAIFSDWSQRVSSMFSFRFSVVVLTGAFRFASSTSQSIESHIERIVVMDSSMISVSGFGLSLSIWRLPDTIASGVLSSWPASWIKCDIVSMLAATGSSVCLTKYLPSR